MGGKQKSETNTSQATSNTFDPWVTGAGQDLFKSASADVAAHPYQGYGGPVQGAFGEGTGLATSKLKDMLAAGTDPGTQSAQTGFQRVMAAINPDASIESYMSPYTEGVLSPQLRKINEAADSLRMKNGAEASMAGAWGGSGMGLAQALADRDREMAIGDATGQAYDKAFTNAQGARSNALSQFLSAAGGAQSAGQQGFQQGTTLSTLLAGLGSQEQQANQTGINTAITVNDANQMGLTKQATSLAQILAMVPKNTSGTSTGKSETSTPDNSGIALLGSLLGAMKI